MEVRRFYIRIINRLDEVVDEKWRLEEVVKD